MKVKIIDYVACLVILLKEQNLITNLKLHKTIFKHKDLYFTAKIYLQNLNLNVNQSDIAFNNIKQMKKCFCLLIIKRLQIHFYNQKTNTLLERELSILNV